MVLVMTEPEKGAVEVVALVVVAVVIWDELEHWVSVVVVVIYC